MKGRAYVTYEDLNVLAYPVFRHRMKMNFEAVASRVSPDEVIKMIIEELSGRKTDKKTNEKAEEKVLEVFPASEDGNKKDKRKFFGRK